MTSINSELSLIVKKQYLEQLSLGDLADWILHSFSPARYRAGNRDVIQFACELLYERSRKSLISVQFIENLWAMFKLEPDRFWMNNVVKLDDRRTG